MSRAKTAEEVREEFLGHIRHLAFYWSRTAGLSPRERCDGLAFSILNIFDGTSPLPAIDLVLAPHPDDEQYHRANNEDWYEPGQVINDCYLHELYLKKEAY
jgi:hypothetical protein